MKHYPPRDQGCDRQCLGPVSVVGEGTILCGFQWVHVWALRDRRRQGGHAWKDHLSGHRPRSITRGPSLFLFPKSPASARGGTIRQPDSPAPFPDRPPPQLHKQMSKVRLAPQLLSELRVFPGPQGWAGESGEEGALRVR